jgi:hypothetical protein
VRDSIKLKNNPSGFSLASWNGILAVLSFPGDLDFVL